MLDGGVSVVMSPKASAARCFRFNAGRTPPPPRADAGRPAGYHARLSRGGDGAVWLALLRRAIGLVEFVLLKTAAAGA